VGGWPGLVGGRDRGGEEDREEGGEGWEAVHLGFSFFFFFFGLAGGSWVWAGRFLGDFDQKDDVSMSGIGFWAWFRQFSSVVLVGLGGEGRQRVVISWIRDLSAVYGSLLVFVLVHPCQFWRLGGQWRGYLTYLITGFFNR